MKLWDYMAEACELEPWEFIGRGISACRRKGPSASLGLSAPLRGLIVAYRSEGGGFRLDIQEDPGPCTIGWDLTDPGWEEWDVTIHDHT